MQSRRLRHAFVCSQPRISAKHEPCPCLTRWTSHLNCRSTPDTSFPTHRRSAARRCARARCLSRSFSAFGCSALPPRLPSAPAPLRSKWDLQTHRFGSNDCIFPNCHRCLWSSCRRPSRVPRERSRGRFSHCRGGISRWAPATRAETKSSPEHRLRETQDVKNWQNAAKHAFGVTRCVRLWRNAIAT